jgi:hypothetical protein
MPAPPEHELCGHRFAETRHGHNRTLRDICRRLDTRGSQRRRLGWSNAGDIRATDQETVEKTRQLPCFARVFEAHDLLREFAIELAIHLNQLLQIIADADKLSEPNALEKSQFGAASTLIGIPVSYLERLMIDRSAEQLYQPENR